MTTTENTLLSKQTRNELNRNNFANHMDKSHKGQRGGLFSLPLSLTIGDSSTYYQKDRRAASLIGKKKGFGNDRGKTSTTDPFNKLISNAIGDPYQDSGKYFLRKEAGKKAHAGSFAPSGKGVHLF